MDKKKWYQQLWVWLLTIAVILILWALIDIFSMYLEKLDWGIFWSALGVISGSAVSILSFVLSKKLAKFEKNKYELEKLPIIMIGSIEKITTKYHNQTFEKVTSPYYPEQHATNYKLLNCALVFELINSSEIFCKVELEKFSAKNEATNLDFSAATIDTEHRNIYLKPSERNKMAFVFSDSDLKGAECNLTLKLRNKYGEAYKQNLSFYIVSVTDNNVMFGMHDYSQPERIKQ